MRQALKRPRVAVPLAATVVVVIAMLVIRASFADDQHAELDCAHYRFPSAVWKQQRERRGSAELEIRRRAADAIVKCRLLDGHTRRDVRRTLGRPHQSDPDGWIYVVGDERGPVVVDSEHLLVKFRADRVIGAELFDG